MKNTYFIIAFAAVLVSCRDQKPPPADPNISQNAEAIPEVSITQVKKDLAAKGYQTFDYLDEETGDTLLMQQYFIAFLKRGPVVGRNKKEGDSLMSLHLEHLGNMYKKGYADISGPFGDDGEIRGITIYNTPTLKMADSLANSDPMVKAGRLVIEVHPWWAGKGFPLR